MILQKTYDVYNLNFNFALFQEKSAHLCCRHLKNWLYSLFPFLFSCKYLQDSSTICHIASEFHLSLAIPELPEISCLAMESLKIFQRIRKSGIFWKLYILLRRCDEIFFTFILYLIFKFIFKKFILQRIKVVFYMHMEQSI